MPIWLRYSSSINPRMAYNLLIAVRYVSVDPSQWQSEHQRFVQKRPYVEEVFLPAHYVNVVVISFGVSTELDDKTSFLVNGQLTG